MQLQTEGRALMGWMFVIAVPPVWLTMSDHTYEEVKKSFRFIYYMSKYIIKSKWNKADCIYISFYK